MKSTVLAIVLLLALAGLWLGLELARSGGDAAATPLATVENEPTRAPDELVAEPRRVQREAAPATEPATASSIAALHSSSASESKPDDLRVRVIDQASGRRLDELEIHLARYLVVERDGAQVGELHDLGKERPGGAEVERRISRERIFELARRKDGAWLVAAVSGVFAPSTETRIPLDPWPTEPIELVVPAYGWVRCRVKDELGGTADVRGRMLLRSEPEENSALDCRLSIFRGETPKLPCGLGLALKIEAGLQGEHESIVQLIARGPQAAGETVEIALPLPPRPAELRVRVMLDADEPLRDAEIELRQELARSVASSAMSQSKHARQRTDREGWLRFTVEDRLAAEGRRRTIQLQHLHATRGPLAGVLDLSQELPPGESSLGELVLQEEPLLAAGRVVDGAGAPLVEVQVGAWIVGEASGLPEQRLTTSTDVTGRFAFRASRRAKHLHLEVRHAGYLAVEGLEVPTGTREVVIALEKAAALRGSARLPSGLDATRLRVELTPSARRSMPHLTPSTSLSPDGSFLIEGIAPEPHDAVFLTAERTPLATIRDLRFAAGEENRDPRAQEVELCQGWRELALRLLDERNQPLARTSFELLSLASSSRRALQSGAEGTCSIWIAPEEQSFRLTAPGRRPRSFEWTAARQDLHLLAGLRVTLPVQATLVPPITRLRVQLGAPEGASTGWVDVLEGRAELVLAEPGRYTLSAAMVIQEQRTTMVSKLELEPPPVIEITEGGPTLLPACVISEAAQRAALGRR
ncbi:MAG: carboxypeptidase regulatory-like domain-containing protein [Planctomycetes bacterium]|nr:carboxypeptidase regulatory-like domain-containing protein [Planctomycetota bacterium]